MPLLAAVLLLHGCTVLDQDSTGTVPQQVLQALHREAQQAYAIDDLDRAGAVYEKILGQTEVDSETWFLIGNIHARKGDHDRAIFAYRSALRINPGDARVWNNLSVIHLKDAWLAAQTAHRHSAGKEPAFINSQKLIDVLSGLTFLGAPDRGPAAPPKGGADIQVPPGAPARPVTQSAPPF